MHHVVALIAERQGGTCTNRLLSRLLSLDAKLLLSRESHWKQSLYLHGVEVRLSTSYPSQILP
ncbi:hypothetical protein Hanom_Chr05g00403921 [Helianthus anomalus]